MLIVEHRCTMDRSQKIRWLPWSVWVFVYLLVQLAKSDIKANWVEWDSLVAAMTTPCVMVFLLEAFCSFQNWSGQLSEGDFFAQPGWRDISAHSPCHLMWTDWTDSTIASDLNSFNIFIWSEPVHPGADDTKSDVRWKHFQLELIAFTSWDDSVKCCGSEIYLYSTTAIDGTLLVELLSATNLTAAITSGSQISVVRISICIWEFPFELAPKPRR
jgi:hypothetical protein